MLVHWRSLIAFGFVFWVLLCLNDLFGGKPYYHLEQDYEPIEEDKLTDIVQNFTGKAFKFGWSILIWNGVTFLFSILFCSCSKTLVWMLVKLFINDKYKSLKLIESKQIPLNQRSDSTLSKIPIKVKASCTSARSSETNVDVKTTVTEEKSCPNLLPGRPKSGILQVQALTTVSEKPLCQTIYQNNKVFSTNEIIEIKSTDRQLENQCARLREEITKLQSASLKEHAALSRKLDAVLIEKKELSKKLTVAQKENRAAKQQLEELLQEKVVLIKRLEAATKELKCNTKTKKYTLQKLDEAIASSEHLRTQLEQVTRDKEILEGKLKLLESEYEKLQERVMVSKQPRSVQSFQEHNTPERDTNNVENDGNAEKDKATTESRMEANLTNPVSQTDLDMKKIQVKIKQLEKNLENFNNTRTEMSFPSKPNIGGSDGSLSARGNVTDNQMRSSDETDMSDSMLVSTPRLKFWAGKPVDVIHALTHRMNEKMRFLDNIRECKSEQVKLDSEIDEYSSEESMNNDVRPPERIVSSSRAFQNFLRFLPMNDSRRRSFSSHSDLNF